jgi:tRNA pseudouridine synthase 10
MSDAEKPRLPSTKIFVEGRYRKLCRDLPQTVFFCPECKGHPRRRRGCERCEGFGKLTRDSVQELVGWVAGSAFKTRKNKFHGAGREDVDVRMLGEGRPFVLELVNPKCLDVDLAALETEINRRNEGRLEVRGLHWTEKARVRVIKETPHAKEYEARVEIEGEPAPHAIEAVLGRRFGVTQQTPARVAHRRADKARERWVEFRSFERVDEPASEPGRTTWQVRIRTEHGTYVKEVVNGEAGATKPSLAELLDRPCRCVELDVVAILDVEGQTETARRAPAAFGENV